MITSVQHPMAKPQAKSQARSQARSQEIESTDTRPVKNGSAANRNSLVSSIAQDGGLRFLQKHLHDKLAEKFPVESFSRGESVEGRSGSYAEAGATESPALTADRIVSFALGLQDVYRRQNQDLSAAELKTGFQVQIRRGIREGFETARGFLKAMNQADAKTTAEIDQTWELVQQKLDEFFAPESEDSEF